MNRSTGLLEIAFWISSRSGLLVWSVMRSLRFGLDRQSVDAIADLAPEDVVDEAVLGDAAQAGERGSRDDGIEVMAVTGHLGSSTRNPRLDPLLQLLGRSRHFTKSSERVAHRYTC